MKGCFMEFNLGNVSRDMRPGFFGTLAIIGGYLLGVILSLAVPAVLLFVGIHFARKFW